MNSWLLLSLLVVSASAFATKPKEDKSVKRPPAVSPEVQLQNARAAVDDGDLKLGRKLYEQLRMNHGAELVTPVSDEVELGGGVSGTTYGDLAGREIEFLTAEISTGKKKIFKNAGETLESIVTAINTNSPDAVLEKMWVRMKWAHCDDDEVHETPPAEALRDLRRHIGKKVVKMKDIRATGAEATALVKFKSNRYLKLELNRYKTGWIWDHFTTCGRAL